MKNKELELQDFLYAKKEILIFDESTSNLDEIKQKKFIETVKNISLNNTIIIISHDEDVIQGCKKYLIKIKRTNSTFLNEKDFLKVF